MSAPDAPGAGPGPAERAPAPVGARPLIPLDDALGRLVAGAAAHRIVETESVPTGEALGRILAVDVISMLDVPPGDNSAMDGWAVNTADVPAPGTVLPVSQRIPAGTVGRPLARGTAARIFTGAQIPAGADAVVMQERCQALPGEGLGSVRVDELPAFGQWIRRRGEDVLHGANVLHRGSRLTPQALGLAASVGAATLAVVRRPRVAVFSTGDELVMPGEPLKPGAIYNSNRYTLRSLLQAGGCEVTDLGIVPDKLDATRTALQRAARFHDLILTSGGVSVGEEDHLKAAIEAEGTLEHFQLAIKPGRPLAFGRVRRDDGTSALVVGLPGNPVSSFVTYLLCVTTVLRALQGAPTALPRGLPMRADFEIARPDPRREFVRVRLNEQGGVELFANQGSGVLTSLAWADGLVDIPAGQRVVRGETVRYLPLSELIAR